MKFLASAFLAFGFASAAFAEECAVNLDGTDQMTFQIAGKKAEKIEIPASCKTFTVHLKHVGSLPKVAMGHNFIVTETKDITEVSTAAIKRGPAVDFLPDMKVEPFKSKVLFFSDKTLGGDAGTPKSVDVVVDPAKLKKGTDYSFFCAFPGHVGMMVGKILVADAAAKPADTKSPVKPAEPAKKK